MDTGTIPGGDVLLVEQYGVVATAILSAFKRFAPSYKFHLAPNLHGAEVLATKTAPELFVIDFDPPQDGVIGFLTRMRSAHSTARVLVITPGISREIAAETAEMGAIHFLEKPFELAEFGDAVELLLHLGRTRKKRRHKELCDLCLVDFVHLFCSAGATSVIVSENEPGETGEVYICDGQICHATCGPFSGLDALAKMYTWHNARFGEEQKKSFFPRTIEGAWTEVIVSALRKAKAIEVEAVTEPSAVPGVQAKDDVIGSKILVIDDAEMLLEFVQATLCDSDPRRQVTTARRGMEGLAKAQQILPDLILVDYCLPDVNGDEICQALLARESTARIPVVLMSSMTQEITAAALRFGNVVATIAKPFLSGQLSALVEKTLAAGGILLPKEAIPEAKISAATPEPPAPPLETALPSTPKPVSHLAPNGEKMPFGHQIQSGTSESVPSGAFPATKEPSNANQPATAADPQSQSAQPWFTPPFISGAAINSRNEAIIHLPLEVIAMRLGSRLQINALRAKPASASVSFQVLSAELPGSAPFDTGFTLGGVTLDGDGRIVEARLVPSPSPLTEIVSRTTFEIAHVTAGIEATDRIRLISGANASMTAQLLLHFEFSAVDVSKKLEVATLILRRRRDSAVLSLEHSVHGDDQSLIPCTISAIQLDSCSRIAELSLTPSPVAQPR